MAKNKQKSFDDFSKIILVHLYGSQKSLYEKRLAVKLGSFLLVPKDTGDKLFQKKLIY